MALLKLIPGARARQLELLLEENAAVIIESFGVGGVPTDGGYLEAIGAAAEKGKIVVMTTQVQNEGSDLGVYKVGHALKGAPGVLEAYDMTTDDLGSVVNLSLSDLCTALQDGNIDAFLYATPAPGTNFTDLAMSFGIKVVDIGQEAVDKLMAEKPWYHTVVIPAGTYDGCDKDITTFAQYTALCARADVPEETVYNLVKTMMENADALEAVHKNAAGTCPERGIEGALIPMHPGAERYYKEVGVLD